MKAWDEDTLTIEKPVVKKEETKAIVIYNDDVNTFEWVIVCLMRKCQHSMEQAEQCAHIIHNNGKCAVKNGTYESLKPLHQSLLDAGLSSKIE
jgi:ATP-dependent Clp protease adaptor protein ClpS